MSATQFALGLIVIFALAFAWTGVEAWLSSLVSHRGDE